MKGAFVKNWIVIFSGTKLNFILFSLAALAFVFCGSYSVLYYLSAALFSCCIVISILEYYERSKWELYSDTLPTGRSGAVMGMYLFALSYFALMGLISLVPAAVCPLLTQNYYDAAGLIIAPATMLAMPTLFFSVLFPVYYRFGYKVFRVILFVFLALCGGAIGGLIGYFEGDLEFDLSLSYFGGMIYSGLPWIIAALAGCLAVYFLSMLLSARLYKNVER